MINYQTERTIAEISRTGSNMKLLTVTSWGENPAKLDLRGWYIEGAGLKPSRGITLTDEEAHNLLEALQVYFDGADME